MSSVPVTQFRSRVMPNVLACPDIVVDQAVLDSCIEFCEKTNIIRTTLEPITLIANQFEVDIDPPQDSKIVQIMRAWVGTEEIFPDQDDSATAFSYSSAISNETVSFGKPRRFSDIGNGQISMSPRPDSTYQLTVRVSVKPSRLAKVVDEALYENWANAITAGALYRLYTMKASWEDAARAAVCNSEYRSAIGNAIIESTRGRNRGEDMVVPVHI